VRVAAYQAPLFTAGCMDALDLIRTQIKRCESECITILCCPEAILGGLADNHRRPSQLAIAANTSTLKTTLSALASETVTTIVGFTEAHIQHRYLSSEYHYPQVLGLYRKREGARRLHEHGLFARFRYNDLN
jgi:predicted amidohydrolase